VNQVGGNLGEITLAGANRANQVVFDELELVCDTAEWITAGAQRRDAKIGGRNLVIAFNFLSFVFVNQRDSASCGES
jgi:hypothetical protein